MNEPELANLQLDELVVVLEQRRKYWCMVAAIMMARLGAVSPGQALYIKATDLMECAGWPIMVGQTDTDQNGNNVHMYVDAPDVREKIERGCWGRDGNRTNTNTNAAEQGTGTVGGANKSSGTTRPPLLYGPDGITPIA